MRPSMRLWLWILLAAMAMIVTLCACQNSNPHDSPVSPLVTQHLFPSPLSASESEQGPVFTIDEPVLAGTREVSGSGPAGVPILLVDVTEVGQRLEATTVDNSGRFLFELSEELPAGHSIGLQIGDLGGTSFNYDDFLRGDTYYDRPLIGILLDIASVVEP